MSASTSTPTASTKTFISIEIDDLISQSAELGDALVSFLTDKLPKQVKISRAEKEVYIRSDNPSTPSKTKLRVYLKRFLHLNNLRGDLKIISRSKDRFAIIEFTVIEYVTE